MDVHEKAESQIPELVEQSLRASEHFYHVFGGPAGVLKILLPRTPHGDAKVIKMFCCCFFLKSHLGWYRDVMV